MRKVWLAMAVGCLMLGGCAIFDATPASGSESSNQGATQHPSTGGLPAAQSTSPIAPVEAPAALANPVALAFAERSTELDASQREIIARIAAQANQASQFVLSGQADRQSIANAREVAIARAVAVREALKEAGVKTQRFRIKYSTAHPRHGVVVQWRQ